MLRSQKGQAILELAVLGSVLIMVFAIVISTSENFNRQQSYMQQTFRSTLFKAQDANDAGSVSTVDFRRMPNVTNPVEIGEITEFSSGNSVLWSDGKKKGVDFTESKQYFLHNRGGYTLIEAGPPGVMPGDMSVSGSGYKTALTSGNVFDKTERSNINTHKHLDAQDTIIDGWATAGGQQVGTGGKLSSGGRYGFDEKGVVRDTSNVRE